MSPTLISWPMPNGLTDGPRTNTDNGGNCPEMSGATVSDRHLPFQSSRSRQSCRVVGGGADPVDGPLRPTAQLERYRSPEVRAPTSQPLRRAAGFCDQYARDRGSAETVPSSSRRSLPGRKLQFTNPFISSPTTKDPITRTRARGSISKAPTTGSSMTLMHSSRLSGSKPPHDNTAEREQNPR
jgi:hypothetical protein